MILTPENSSSKKTIIISGNIINSIENGFIEPK